MNKMNIQKYNKLRKIRDAFKKITQLSFNISQIERRFPIDTLDEQSFDPMLKVYEDFLKELDLAQKDIVNSLFK